jgi:hypothetical protein
MYSLKRLRNIINRTWLTARIELKWCQDKRHLPLTRDHHELYFIIHRFCWYELGDFPNLIDCRDFNDKIQWLKLFDQRSETIQCSDKILMRDYVRERVGEEHIVEIYQVHDHFYQINFDLLPNDFVIKTNHDSGTVIQVWEKKILDFNVIQKQIEKSLQKIYGWEKGEWAYAFVRPKVFVEELLYVQKNLSPPDYKFHCVNGKIQWLQFIYDRGRSTKECIVTPSGIVTSIHFDHNMEHKESFKIPDQWNKMKYIVEKVAEGFKYVRVDCYLVGKKIYIGELTFFPLMGCYKGEGQKVLGKYLNFDRESYNPPLISHLKNNGYEKEVPNIVRN